MNNKEMTKDCHEVLAIAKNNFYNNCHYAFCSDGKNIQKFYNSPCYIDIRGPSISHLSLCINQYKEKRFADSPKEMKRLISYLNWIIRRSPWSKAFRYPKKSPKVYLRDGVVMNTEKCSQYVVGAMSALRHAWEYPYFLDAWDKFIELGFSKESSFILANVFDVEGKMSNPNDNHATFQIDVIAIDSFSNFKEGKYPKYAKLPSMNKNALNYRGIFHLFEGGQNKALIDCIAPFKILTGEGWKQTISYPFTPEFVKALKEFVNE